MRNQKRRLEARGGRRAGNQKFVEQVSFYSPFNTSTGVNSKMKDAQGNVTPTQKFLAFKRKVPAGSVPVQPATTTMVVNNESEEVVFSEQLVGEEQPA